MLATGVVGAVEDPWIRWSWVSGHADAILAALVQHIQLTVIAVVIGLLIAVPLGLVAWRSRLFRGPIISVTGILYTIPSLALFSFLLPFTGLTVLTAEIGLVSYTLLILVRNIVVGLNAVPDEVREAARGMGFRPRAELARIDIPLAIPAIVRPDATERSSSEIASSLPSCANSSRCFISNQLVRLPPERSRFIRTRTQLPCSFSPSSLNFKVPFLSASSGDSSPSGVQ